MKSVIPDHEIEEWARKDVEYRKDFIPLNPTRSIPNIIMYITIVNLFVMSPPPYLLSFVLSTQ